MTRILSVIRPTTLAKMQAANGDVRPGDAMDTDVEYVKCRQEVVLLADRVAFPRTPARMTDAFRGFTTNNG